MSMNGSKVLWQTQKGSREAFNERLESLPNECGPPYNPVVRFCYLDSWKEILTDKAGGYRFHSINLITAALFGVIIIEQHNLGTFLGGKKCKWLSFRKSLEILYCQ
jgi:hypothetical protein